MSLNFYMDLIRPTLTPVISIWIIHPGLFQKSLEFYMDTPQGSNFFSQFLYGRGSGIPQGFQGSFLTPRGIACEPKSEIELRQCLSCILETLVISYSVQ